MNKLSNRQRQALEQIEAFRDAQVSRLNYLIQQGHFSDRPDAKPCKWVSVVALRRAYPGIRRDTLEALVKAGSLLRRSTDGFGPEVLVTRSASADEIAKAEEIILQQERDAEDRFRALCGD